MYVTSALRLAWRRSSTTIRSIQWSFSVHSRGQADGSPWILHAEGSLRRGRSAEVVELIDSIVTRCAEVPVGAHYEALRARGLAQVGDALREVAGMHLARSGSPGGTTSLFLRGGQSNYVKVLVDDNNVTIAGHPQEYTRGFDVALDEGVVRQHTEP